MSEKMIPQEGEFAPYYKKYIDQVKSEDIFKVLMDQIESVRFFYEKMGEEKSNQAYAAGKWSAKEVLGHISDTDRVMAYRAMCIARGEAQSLPGFDQDEYVAKGKFNDISMTRLLEEFEMTRYAIVAMCKNFPDSAYQSIGNANETAVSVRGLIYIIAGHTLHHLSILQERYI
ncbi:DinB family protein [Mongoliibacter ruber]|uniref:DinB family protein n=1 Tax=Mongoliibacter ruber TaxID=1750599 RepID=A0A2T0WDQ6_9BACT|nr:DinB family protein [Mongoliibacter ruber]PRY84843.1 DinB family protein [Mongoliibacter ruber]